MSTSHYTTTMDGLDGVISKILEEYGDDVKDALEEAGDEITKETLKVVKASAPVKTGNYKKHIASKKSKDGLLGGFENVVYVRPGATGLGHLLEHGHAIHGGSGRASGTPHFSTGEEYVKSNFENKAIEKIERL